MLTLAESLKPWIDDYLRQLPRWTVDELYKLRAVKVFQDNWNLNATDFPAMLEMSLSGTENLLTSTQYLPRLMIQRFAAQMPEEVRAGFKKLFDEIQPLIPRINKFREEAESWRKRYAGKPAANHYQQTRTIMTYLTLRFPDVYYLFKPTMYKEFARLVGVPVDKRQKAGNERLQGYLLLAEQVREILAKNKEVVTAHRARLTADCYMDPALHLLTQDFIYCTIRANEEAEQNAVEESEDEDTGVEQAGDEDAMPVSKPRWWVIGAGEGAYKWSSWKEDGIMSIGWDDLGDLRDYNSKDEVQKALQEQDNSTKRSNDALACWQFYKYISIYDYVIVKNGRTVVEGVGRVAGPYKYDPSLYEFHHVRRVDWLLEGPWNRAADEMFGTKTLTDVTGQSLAKLIMLELDTQTQLRWIGGTSAKPIVIDGDGENVDSVEIELPAYTFADAAAELFMPEEDLAGLLASLKRKKNLILQGPPGVGKSFVAKRLAYLLLEQVDEARVEMVQFHPSYSYEDFIIGYRANEDGGFARETGVLLKFVRNKALLAPTKPHVFIIDELNRANLGKVLGECMLLLESSKRGPEHKVMLPYGNEFMYLPDNLYIIGTMNTADRSLALVDFALRRRFAFKRLQPELGERFAKHMTQRGVAADFVVQLVAAVTRLNAKIEHDRTLGLDFLIGHSYYSDGPQDEETDQQWYDRVLEDEIGPQLEEYWIETPVQAKAAVQLMQLSAVELVTSVNE